MFYTNAIQLLRTNINFGEIISLWHGDVSRQQHLLRAETPLSGGEEKTAVGKRST
jgi:hypothetical protein